MNSQPPRQLRADAARNYARILRAARETFAASGPNAPLEEIARRAGVGIATLYRRFPDREELVRQAIEQLLTEMISPATEQALADENPRRGLATLLSAAMSIATRERNTLAAAKDVRATTEEVANQFFESLTLLTQRGQQAGLIRADLVPDDLCTIVGMLVGALWTTDPDSDGWRRYVTLLLDGLSPDAASPLPPSTRKIWKSEHWPIPADD